MNNEEIGKKVSISRQSANVMRRRFERLGLMRTLNIPDLKQLNFKLLVFGHFNMNPTTVLDIKERSKDIVCCVFCEMPNSPLNKENHIFTVSGDLEMVSISAFESYIEYQKTYRELINFLKKIGYFYMTL